MGDSVIQISTSGAAVLVIGLFALVFTFGLVLLKQFEERAAIRDQSAREIMDADRLTRASEMKDVRGAVQIESSRIGQLGEQVDTLLTLDRRVNVIEEWRRHVPSRTDIDEVKAMVSAVGGQVQALGERSTGTQKAVSRIESYLLERK